MYLGCTPLLFLRSVEPKPKEPKKKNYHYYHYYHYCHYYHYYHSTTRATPRTELKRKSSSERASPPSFALPILSHGLASSGSPSDRIESNRIESNRIASEPRGAAASAFGVSPFLSGEISAEAEEELVQLSE